MRRGTLEIKTSEVSKFPLTFDETRKLTINHEEKLHRHPKAEALRRTSASFDDRSRPSHFS